jgi:hypothetical protein
MGACPASDGEKNGGRLFRRPKLTPNCRAEKKEGRKDGTWPALSLARRCLSLNILSIFYNFSTCFK